MIFLWGKNNPLIIYSTMDLAYCPCYCHMMTMRECLWEGEMVQQEHNGQVRYKGSWQNIFRIFFFFIMPMFKRKPRSLLKQIMSIFHELICTP